MPAKSDTKGWLIGNFKTQIGEDGQGKDEILDIRRSSPYIKQPFSDFIYQTDPMLLLQNISNLKVPTPKIRVVEDDSK
jgi:hypothetical protein